MGVVSCGTTMLDQGVFQNIGAVTWDTTAKTASFTAASGNGYFVNTTSGAVTMTLPATPSAGDIVSIKDYAGTFATNNLTIARNGSNLDGSAGDTVRNTDNESLTLVYVDGTQGWKSVEEGTGFIGEQYIVATGGTITCCGDYKIHTFTGPGTFCVSQAGTGANAVVDYLVVAGGGGGAGASSGGAGAGGFRVSNDTCMPAPLTSPLANPTGITVTESAFPITVGGGGTGTSNPANGGQGSNSIFSTITSTGGGGGGRANQPGCSGGSGGGGGGEGNPPAPGGSGNTPPVTPSQGNDGGAGGQGPSNRTAGGGGGAGAVGGPGAPNTGDGGIGSFMVGSGFAGCNGTTGPVCGARYFAGGGGGGYEAFSGNNGAGGAGGGGPGGPAPGNTKGPGTPGTTNTGGGGGGGSRGDPGTNNCETGGNGGSGVVIIRYKYQ